jgi:hypothetical protein
MSAVPTELFPAGAAVFSPCQRYRYRLERDLGSRRTVTFCLVNPSTATAETDDATIRRCIGFSRSWGFGRLLVVNLFAYRATDIRKLREVQDPVGPNNDAHILEAANEAELLIAAWGVLDPKVPCALRPRADHVLSLLAGRLVHCLRRTPGGYPEHALFLPADLLPEVYRTR